MATRTKGFFEQNHPSKRPAQWQHPKKLPLQEAPTNVQTVRTSIPASAKAKSKLQAFQFDSDETTEPNLHKSGKENLQSRDHPNVTVTGDEAIAGQHDRPENSTLGSSEITPKMPSLPHANTFPSTPSGRLSLEDLIGNGDGQSRIVTAADRSPEEQIGWNPQSSAFTPNRKRKRARSSSPSYPMTSSQSLEKSAFLDNNAAMAPRESNTPEADPITALWQAYQGRQSDNGHNLPDLDHLIAQASPRLLETPIKGGGLRRWASTGNDWPSTKRKRTCVNATSNISMWRDQTDRDHGGKSRVAFMLQKIQDSLATQKLEQAQLKPGTDAPSSSSPLPDSRTRDLDMHTSASPPKARQRPSVQTGRSASNAPVAEVPKSNSCPMHAPRERSEMATSTTDHPKQESFISAPLHLQSKARLPAYKRPSVTRLQSVPEAPLQIPPLLQTPDLDEFEDEFDLTVDDLNDLLSQIPNTQHTLTDDPGANAFLHDLPAQPAQIEDINFDDDDDDEFGCDDIDEATLVQAEISATQVPRQSRYEHLPDVSTISEPLDHSSSVNLESSSQKTSPRLFRYVIREIIDGEYTNPKGTRCSERLLVAEDSRSSITAAITLRGSWADTSISRGNVIHIAYSKPTPNSQDVKCDPPGQILINDDDTSPLLVVHPDHMLSATTVADSFDCIRKAVLQDRIKATGDTNKAMVYGMILHEIFQQALSANKWDAQFLSHLTDHTIRNHVEGLWELGMSDSNLAKEEIKAKMGELAAWASVFVLPEPSEASLVDDQSGDKVRMSISNVIAIEEHVWSPRYGLKGNIDATVQSSVISSSSTLSRLLLPFEVKTGRTTQSAAHRAQTALYTLLLSDRYDVHVAAGILYYMEGSSMSRVAPPPNEIRQMVQQRNRLASYIHAARNPPIGREGRVQPLQSQEIETSGLPKVLRNPFKCGRCYANQSCFTFHALQENGNAETAGMVDDSRKDHSLVWREVVGHLMLSTKNEHHFTALKSWFSKWDRLLTFEESEQSRSRRELWTMSSSEREKIGRCFGYLALTRDLTPKSSLPSTMVDGIEGSGGKINRFTYSFARTKRSDSRSFTEGSQLVVGEPVVVSSEKGQWALANGYVVAVTKDEMTVAVDRRLGSARQRMSTFDPGRNQAFRGISGMDVFQGDAISSTSQNDLYRLDKDEFSNGLALIRNNLVTLMSTHPMHANLRDQIILGAVPRFESSPGPITFAPSQLGSMNDDQRHAVQTVMNAKDYALILGMPGTGKTTTIAHIIRALIADGQSILLTSFTHTAVDNVLLKIRDVVPAGSILRIGVPAKINEQVKEFCQLAATPRQTIGEIDKAYMGTQIVAATCMGVNHALFRRRAFDVCIVDEASQITLPTILGPLLHARKFILVGDHYQLPPLVQDRTALEGGLDISLFRQLSEEHPHAIAKLGLQYRMCADIMSLSNDLIYSGQLRCGNEAVAVRTIHLPNSQALTSFHSAQTSCPGRSNCWLSHITNPARRVIFANIDTLGRSALETLSAGKNITNQLEAMLTAQIVLSLLALGVPSAEIGVITLYRSQLALLRQTFLRAGIGQGVEIDSADRFQGRDKECVVLSMVRSNKAGVVGDLLKDWRRVNVALTRARSKLIILGSARTLRHNDLLSRLLDIVAAKGWGLDVPSDVEMSHNFGFGTVEPTNVLAKSVAEEMSESSGVGKVEVKVLGDSRTGGNRGPKSSPRVIDGRKSGGGGPKARRIRDQMAIEILEDL